MGLPTCLCKCTLGIINGLVLIVGILIAAVGGILLAMSNNAGLSKTLEEWIKKIIGTIGVIDKDSNVNSMSFSDLLQPAAIIFLVVGLVIAGIAIIGYCGLTCYVIILKLYVAVIILILIVEIVIVALFFTKTFDSTIRKLSKDIIDNHYVDIDGTDLYSVIPNVIMINFQCCGLDGYTDFHTAKLWNSTREITITPNHKEVFNLTTPIACCATTGKFPDVKAVDTYCAVYPGNGTSNWETGCWSKVIEVISPYRTAAILIITAGFVVQGLLILVVFLIIWDNSKSKVFPV